MLAAFHIGKGTKCTACGYVLWKDQPHHFNPLHFMKCGVCENIACGIGTKT